MSFKKRLSISLMPRFFFLMILILPLLSCGTDPDCITSGSSLVRVNFLKADNENADSLFFNAVFTSANEDSLIAGKDTLSTLQLPLNPASDVTEFILENRALNDSILVFDTIRLSYDRLQRIISPECGVELSFINLNIQKSTFDSLALVNGELIRNNNNANIEIYR